MTLCYIYIHKWFSLKSCFIFYIKILWKERKDGLIINVVYDKRVWDLRGLETIMDTNKDRFYVKLKYLTLICLFNNQCILTGAAITISEYTTLFLRRNSTKQTN